VAKNSTFDIPLPAWLIGSFGQTILTTMHADICAANDEAAVARFRDVLRRLEAQPERDDWFTGCDLYTFTIGGETLSVVRDEWSLDIEGPDHLVKKIALEYAQAGA
jgi:hypothetical protein